MPTVEEPPVEVSVIPPKVGNQILWFNMADRRVVPIPGVIVNAGIHLMVEVVTWGAQEPAKYRVSVPHMSDPRIHENIELRKGGAWEYAPSDDLSQLKNEVARLTKTVTEMESLIR